MYFDWIVCVGVMFCYIENGLEGLIKGKKVYVVMVCGGKYFGMLNDSYMLYLCLFFGFIGLIDVNFIYVEGLNFGLDV